MYFISTYVPLYVWMNDVCTCTLYVHYMICCRYIHITIIVRGSSSFVINVNADSCIVKVQGFIYFTLTCRISPPHLTSSGTVFFLTPQLLLRRRSARCARLPPAQSLCHVYYDEFFGSPQKNFANERGFDFLDDRRTDGRTDGRTGILWKFWVSSASLDSS